MWETISSSDEISRFMERVYDFHDSCVKEISYISGAYVDDSLSMYPLNDRRILRVIKFHDRDGVSGAKVSQAFSR